MGKTHPVALKNTDRQKKEHKAGKNSNKTKNKERKACKAEKQYANAPAGKETVMATTPKTISKEQLVANEVAYIHGTVSFSRITQQVEGKALEKYNEGRQYPVNRPFTSISVENATIECVNGKENPTILERYLAEHLYQPKNNPNTWGYTAINKSGNLPTCGHKNPQTGQIDEIVPEHELANGSHVTLMIKAFASKSGNGVGLELVIINDPAVQYYDPSNIRSALQTRGIVWNPMAQDEKKKKQEALAQSQAAAPAVQAAAPQAAPYGAPAAQSPQEAALAAQAQQYAQGAYAANSYTAPAQADPGFYEAADTQDGYQEAAYGYGYDTPDIMP